MRRNYFVFLLIAIIVMFGFSKVGQYMNYRVAKRKISSKYKGVVIEKFFSRTTHLKIQVNNEVKDLSTLNGELLNFITIGDSIYKMKNKNLCIVVRNGEKKLFKYVDP